jgi:outer membrane protein OmpA-like peptidoglycan-associated protein
MNIKSHLIILLTLCFPLLSACSNHAEKPYNDQPISLQQASTSVATQLFEGINKDQGLIGKFSQKTIAIDVLVDAYSQEQLLINQQITQYIQQVGKSYTHNPLKPLSRESLRTSRYVIQGGIALEQHPSSSLGKLYHLQGFVRNARNGKIITRADAWIADKNLNYQRQPEFKDSPVYTLYKQAHPTQITPHQYQGFQTLALLNEAGQAYAKKQYAQAINLYQQAAQRPDGLAPRTYAGLYISHIRLQQTQEAEAALEKLLAVSFAQTHALTLKILFKVDSTELYGDNTTQGQYRLWANKIAAYLQASPRCLAITGHSSHTGTAEYNDVLSLERAKRVQVMMSDYFPAIGDKIHTDGKGFRENIVGLGTDDERDMLDRRIEFKLPACGAH